MIGCIAIVVLIILGLGMSLLVSWVLMLVLNALGISVGFWICFGIVFVLSFLFRQSRSTVNVNRGK